MQVVEFAERLRHMQLKSGMPIFAAVYHLAYALCDEQYSHLVTQSNAPCAFVWKVQGYPDSVFGLDCFVEHNQEVDAYLQTLEERLRDLLQLWHKSYSVVSYQEHAYMRFSLPHALLKGSEAWVQDMMESICLNSREWRDCQASHVIGDILSDFATAAKSRVQFERIWKDASLDYFRTYGESVYQRLDTLASITCSTMRCSVSTDDSTIRVTFDEAKEERK